MGPYCLVTLPPTEISQRIGDVQTALCPKARGILTRNWQAATTKFLHSEGLPYIKILVWSVKAEILVKMDWYFLRPTQSCSAQKSPATRPFVHSAFLQCATEHLPLFAGGASAFTLKMLIAVLLGSTIAKLPVPFVTAVSADLS
jgi:hypothetical protein